MKFKKVISIIIAICVVLVSLPVAAYTVNITPEISLDEFTEQLQEIQSEHDGNYVSEIKIEDGSEFCFVDGEENILTDSQGDAAEAVVTDNDFEIPYTVIEQYVETPEISAYSLDDNNSAEETIDKETAEDLGFEVEIEDGTAVLTQPYQTERLIVKSKYDINPLDSVGIVEGYNDLHIVQFDNQESAKEAEEYYNSQKLIEYAEPDIVMSTMDIDYTVEESAVTSSSIKYDNHLSWGSESIGVDDYIDYLGDVSELPEIVVGIIDTGIDLDHEFLQDRIIETGFNLSDSGTKTSEDDDNGHGTHVAGIVADNTLKNIKIKAYKCLNSDGNGESADTCLAIYKALEDGVDVINMSLGSKGKSTAMEAAVNEAVKNGVTVCVSAGNSGADASKYTPACIESCITVAAISAYDEQPYWTNWGERVDITAPGVSVYSTYKENSYKTLSGTSMASPFAAAASALILCKNPNYTPEDICNVLINNGRIWYKESDKNYSDSLYGKKALYIGTLNDFDKERTILPEFSIESGRYSDSIILEINCKDEDAEIYYTLDGTRASQDTGTLYTEPIVIDKITNVHAVAYAPNKLRSLQITADYYIVTTDPDENYVIDSDGTIIEYLGSNDFLNIPETISGITVTGIGAEVFSKSNIGMIILPDTVKTIGEKAFYNCNNLYSVTCKNLTSVASYAFYSCDQLYLFDCDALEYVGKCGFRSCGNLSEINLTDLKSVDSYGFYSATQITQLYNENLTEINEYAFEYCEGLIYIDLPNTIKVSKCAFRCCYSLEYINLPKLETLCDLAMESLYNLKELELPNLKVLESSNPKKGGGHFSDCVALKKISLPKLEGELPADTFLFTSSLESIHLDKVTSVNESAFEGSKIKSAIFEKATYIGDHAFDDCHNLEIIYAPAVTEIGYRVFDGANMLSTLFLPKLESTQSFPRCDGTTIYLSESFNNFNDTYSTTFLCNIIAPSGSYANSLSNENGYTFLPSEYCAYSGFDGESFVYTCSENGLTCSMPQSILGIMWGDYLPINKGEDFMTHGFLLDTVPDGIINAKDFARINNPFLPDDTQAADTDVPFGE